MRLSIDAMNPRSNIYRALIANPGTEFIRDKQTIYIRNLEAPSGGGVGTARAMAHAYGVFATAGAELGLRADTLKLLAAPAVPPTHGFYDECMKNEAQFSLGFMKPSEAWPMGTDVDGVWRTRRGRRVWFRRSRRRPRVRLRDEPHGDAPDRRSAGSGAEGRAVFRPSRRCLRARPMENTQYMEAAVPARPQERHRMGRIGWLRAAVLGANDGIVSISSLLVGVAAASASRSDILIAGTAGMVAGALSMAAGEYVSVSSQADTEQAELTRERRELETSPAYEEDELTEIYIRRGVESSVARTVAQQLMAKDALGAHARDELGLIDVLAARPLQAALASASAFAVGALLPIAAAVGASTSGLSWTVAAVSLISLVILGGIAAQAGGASVVRGAGRVAFWGTLAMVVTAIVGRIFGTVV